MYVKKKKNVVGASHIFFLFVVAFGVSVCVCVSYFCPPNYYRPSKKERGVGRRGRIFLFFFFGSEVQRYCDYYFYFILFLLLLCLFVFFSRFSEHNLIPTK